MKIDEKWLRRALALARKGAGRVHPNPMVGAVLVRGSRVVAEGYHRRYGGPHAEIEAIRRAGAHGVPIVEDDPYSDLRYEGEDLPPLASFDPERVIHLGSFSKILAPGLRVGWVVAPAPIRRKLTVLKQGADLHTGTFVQRVVYEAARDGFLDRHIPHVRALHRERRTRCWPPSSGTSRLASGGRGPRAVCSCGSPCPRASTRGELLRAALRENVAFVPGSPFFPNGGGSHCLRLNFSYSPPATIDAGIRRLGGVLHAALRDAA